MTGELSKILQRLQDGDRSADAELFALVYAELRNLAAAKLRNHQPGMTLNPTALVHEAYLRLEPNTAAGAWNNRGHFFAAASEAMRRVLIDAARSRNARKRGAQYQRVQLDEATVSAATVDDDQLLALNDALDQLAQRKPQVAELVKLRFFGGMTSDEAAEVMKISRRTAQNWWAFAKAWLSAEISDD